MGGGIHVSSQHHCPGKNRQTPADCKPACDAPRAATCSLGVDFQWDLRKDRGQSCFPSSHHDSRSKNLQAKNKKITQQAKRHSQRKGKGVEQHAGGSHGAFRFAFRRFTAVWVGDVLFSQSQNCCLSCLSCCSAGGDDKTNFRIAQKQPSFTPFLIGVNDPVVGARSQCPAGSRLRVQQWWLQTHFSPGVFTHQQKVCPQVCTLAGLQASN